MTASTFPTDAAIEAITLASRLLGQLHHNLTVENDCAVVCNDCGAHWLCDIHNGKLRLTESAEGNHSCESEILRAISVKGLYAELGRRRVAKRKSPGRQGGRPVGSIDSQPRTRRGRDEVSTGRPIIAEGDGV